MRFVVGPSWPSSPTRVALLTRDNWDDWFQFETTLILKVRDSNEQIHRIGSLKMGESPMPARSAALPTTFTTLPDRFFSLGQDESYYQRLTELSDADRDEILGALNDVARDLDRFERYFDEPVMGKSLLRFVSPLTVRGQFHRLTQGGARLSPYTFQYSGPVRSAKHKAPVLTFVVRPESTPPTNVHVLIGRNGVGKTYLLNNMARAVVDGREADSDAV
jgi:hypothetical protein